MTYQTALDISIKYLKQAERKARDEVNCLSHNENFMTATSAAARDRFEETREARRKLESIQFKEV